MKKISFILVILLQIQSYASLNFHYPLGDDRSQYRIGLNSLVDEREYERDQVQIDKITKKGNALNFEYYRSFSSKYELGVELSYLMGGDYKENYSEELEYIADKETDTSGIKEPLFLFTYWFDHQFGNNFKQAMKVTYRPKIFEPSASDFAEGRHVLSLSYIYSYLNDGFEMSGEIYSKIYSKRELSLPGGLKDDTSSFSEAGFKLTPGYIFSKQSVHAILGYSSTTDYNTKNAFFSRQSDKGFIWNYGFNYRHNLSKGNLIEFLAKRKASTFNSIEEDPTRNVEFKISETTFLLKWWRTI